MVFLAVMCGCESWTIKKAEWRRIDAFELWCWRRLLRVTWTARRSNPVNSKGNQSWIFIGSTDVEAETPILWPPDMKSWHLKRPWCCERLKVGGDGDDRGWDDWMASLTQWAWAWVDSGSWQWTGRPGVLQSTPGVMKSQTRWATELNWTESFGIWIKRQETKLNKSL